MAGPGTSARIIDNCPEAFAAVDGDLRVTAWNTAATALTGFERGDVMGQVLPTLTARQRAGLGAWLDKVEEWDHLVPLVRPSTQASGRISQICVTSVFRMGADEGGGPGFGMFFREVRPSDIHTHARNAFSGELARSVRTDDVLSALDRIIAELFPGHRGFFVRRDDSAGQWQGWLSVGDFHEWAETLVVEQPDALEQAVRSGRGVPTTVRVRHVTQPAVIVPAGPDSSGTALILVIVIDDVDVDAADTEGVSEIDDELAIALASEAWAALTRVEAVGELEGKVEILEAIAGVAQTAGLETEQVADHLTRHAAASLSCERAALYLWDTDGTSLTLASFYATDMSYRVDKAQHRAGLKAAQEMLDSIDPFLTQDTRTCPWLDGPWDHDAGALAVYGMPLAIGAEKVGLLVVAHTRANPRGFTSLCTQVGQAVSSQASLALWNAQLFEAQRTATEQFKRMDQQRADWIAGIVHDLRTPLTSISGYVKTILHAGDRLSEDRRQQGLLAIERQSVRVSRMLDDMMDSAMAEAGVLSPERQIPLRLADAVRDAVLVASSEQQDQVRIDADSDVEVLGDLGQLTRVVQNLILNALDHTAPGTAISIVLRPDRDQACLRVIDQGPGVPADVDVFNRFSRGSAGGTGLGLYTVKRIVELHRGSINLGPAEQGGTVVTVSIPLRPVD